MVKWNLGAKSVPGAACMAPSAHALAFARREASAVHGFRRFP